MIAAKTRVSEVLDEWLINTLLDLILAVVLCAL